MPSAGNLPPKLRAGDHALVGRRLVAGLACGDGGGTVVCPAVLSVGAVMLAAPILNPPEFTLRRRMTSGAAAVDDCRSECGSAEVVTIVMLAKVPATLRPWQLRQVVTPWWVPVTE